MIFQLILCLIFCKETLHLQPMERRLGNPQCILHLVITDGGASSVLQVFNQFRYSRYFYHIWRKTQVLNGNSVVVFGLPEWLVVLNYTTLYSSWHLDIFLFLFVFSFFLFCFFAFWSLNHFFLLTYLWGALFAGYYEEYTVHVVELFERFTVWDSVVLYFLTTLKIICRLCGNIANNQLEFTKISKAISSAFFVRGLEQLLKSYLRATSLAH